MENKSPAISNKHGLWRPGASLYAARRFFIASAEHLLAKGRRRYVVDASEAAGEIVNIAKAGLRRDAGAVSYTHLTLPTN